MPRKKGKSVSSTMPPEKGKSVSSAMPPKKGKSFSSPELLDLPDVVLRCIDGQNFSVDPIWCYESELIRRKFTLYSHLKIPIRVKIPGDIIPAVNNFCFRRWEIVKTHHRDDKLIVRMLKKFDREFIGLTSPYLDELMAAAYELRIKSLFDLTRNAIGHQSAKLMKSYLTKVFNEHKYKYSSGMCKFLCEDDKYVPVDLSCCVESETICYKLIGTDLRSLSDETIRYKLIGDEEEEEEEEEDIPRFPIISQVPSRIVEMVNDFCVSRYDIVEAYWGMGDNRFSDMLNLFDYSFVQKKPLNLLVLLMDAACQLRIKSLFDLTRNAIVDRLDGKSAQEIRTIFNMPGFSHDLWVMPMPRNSWAFK